MTTKKVKMISEFSSIKSQPKWLVEIRINNFSSIKANDNRKLIDGIKRLIENYNNGGENHRN